MLTGLDWTIIVSYLVLSLIIGLYFSRRAGKNISEFFLSGRNLPWWLAGTSMVATTFAADTPLAVNELVVTKGISGNWLWWSFAFGGILTTFFFARLWRRSEVLTDLELIELRYSGKPAAFLRGFRAIYLGLFINAVIIGWVNSALITILHVFFQIPVADALWYTAGCMVLVAFYTSLSGMWGVVVTDAIQFVIAMAGCITLAVIVVNSPEIGGIAALKSKVPASALSFFPDIGSTGGVGKTLALTVASFFAYIGVIWWSSWYPGAEPGGGGYVAQRMLSTKNEKHSIYATLFFQIMHYCARPWPWILVGLCSLILYPGIAKPGEGYVMAMQQFLPSGLRGLLLVAFFAAYMSTISTQLNWGTSYLVNDLYKRFLTPKNRESDPKKLVMVSRLATVLMMIAGLIATTQIGSISGAWSFIMECGAGLGLVLILRWYWWRINAWSEIAATVAPFVAYTACLLLNHHYPGEFGFPDSLFITVAFTTLAWFIVTCMTSPTSPSVLHSFYKKVRPEGAWGPVRQALGIAPAPSRIPSLLVCWLSSVAMVYSMLFLIGKIIFQEWNEAGICAGVALVSFLIMRFFANRTRIFAD